MLIRKFILRHIGREDLLAGIPGTVMALASLGMAAVMFNDQALAERFAALRYWPAYELISLAIFQYMIFIFNPDPGGPIGGPLPPVWARVAAILVIPAFLIGLKASFFLFKQVFIYFWPFIIPKAVALYLHRPTDKDMTVGCLGALIGFSFLVLLYFIAFSLEAGPAWYVFAGLPYFMLVGAYEVISEPLHQLPDYDYWDNNEE